LGRSVNGLKVCEKRVLRIFGPKRDEIIGGWRNLLNEDFHTLGSSPDVIRTGQGVDRACSTHQRRGMRGKAKGKRPLRRLRRRWEDNIKTDLREIGWGGMNWIHVS
jgi:hypothetical protein